MFQCNLYLKNLQKMIVEILIILLSLIIQDYHKIYLLVTS